VQITNLYNEYKKTIDENYDNFLVNYNVVKKWYFDNKDLFSK
jgi:hypothetical protein